MYDCLTITVHTKANTDSHSATVNSDNHQRTKQQVEKRDQCMEEKAAEEKTW